MTRQKYFLHIPKTGGTSLNSYLESNFNPGEICPAWLLPHLFALSQEELSTYKLFKGHLWFGLNSYLNKDLDYLTMLRDPIDRTISYYYHVKRSPEGYRHAQMNEENWSIYDFVTHQETNWDLINCQTLFLAVDLDYHRLANDPVGYGQAVVKGYARRGNDRALLNLAKKRLEKFIFVGITERMQDSLLLLAHQMKWDLDVSVPKLNVGENRPNHDLPPETVSAIQEITQLDQQLYDWALQRFERRLEKLTKAESNFIMNFLVRFFPITSRFKGL